MKKACILISLIIFAAGCSKKGDDRLEERAEIEAKGEIRAEEERATKLVKDLKQQARFYEALYGEYEGELNTGSQVFRLRVNFVPKLPIYISDERSLTVSEAEDYLINQSFNIHVLSWDPDNNLTASGCQVEGVKPDLINGEIFISSEACSNLFLMAINDAELNNNKSLKDRYRSAVNGVSKTIAGALLKGQNDVVNEIVGEMRPVTNASVYRFKLERVEP